ncbi:MAG: prefoldin subunit alpha [Thermoplasmata archaeon]|nr:MAG: prefoldin subunit alpha [Thermoplasmata archaeon]
MMTNDEEISRYLVLIEQYKEQINSLEMQSSYVQAMLADYTKAKITLQQLSKTEKGSEILVPIGGSTFVEAISKGNSKVLFDIGRGIVAEKNIDDAIEKIDKRIEELQKTYEKILSMMQQLQNEMETVSTKAQKLMYEKEK